MVQAEEKAVVSIESFLRKNVRDVEETKEVKFDRFDGPFVIRTVTEQENTGLRKRATKHIPNKRGQIIEQTDSQAYADALITAALVSPDPNNAELQNSWGTPGKPVETIKAMLHAGEYAELGEQIQKLSGFDTESVDEIVEDVKN